jgi:hypothetical protein
MANTISTPPKISPMSQYTSEYPKDIGFDPVYTQFLESFYAISDTPDAHEEYVSQFTKNATLIMASKKCVGSSGIVHTSPIFFLSPSPSPSPSPYLLSLSILHLF